MAALAALAGLGAAVGPAVGAVTPEAIAAGVAAGVPAAAGITLPSLSTIASIAGPAASIGGTILSAKAQSDQAAYASELAKVQNQVLQQKANQDAAAAERQQQTLERQTTYVQSRARALAAASGGSATDPSVLALSGQIAQQGEFNALSALYNGQAQAQADQYQGAIDLFQARAGESAVPGAIAGTVLSGISSALTNRALLSYYKSSGQAPLFFGNV